MKWKKLTQKKGSVLARYLISMSISKYLGKINDFGVYWKSYKYINDTNYIDEESVLETFRMTKGVVLNKGIDNFNQGTIAQGKKLIDATKETLKNKLSKKTNKELKELFDQFCREYIVMWAYICNRFALNEALSEEIEQELGRIIKDEEKLKQYLMAITLPEEETYIGEQQKRLTEAAIKIERNKGEISKEIYQEIKDIHKDFKWIGIMFFLGKEQSLEEFIEVAKIIVEKGAVRKKQDIKEKTELNNRLFNELIDKINSDELKKKIKLLGISSLYRAQELKYLCMGECFAIPLFEEIGRRMGLDYKGFVSATYDEIIDFLEGEVVDLEAIKERQKEYALLMINGNIRILIGEELAKLKGAGKDYDNVTELKGTVACQGKVTGNVKLILDKSEIYKLNKGEILVTLMTTPDFVMAMEKAGAIVTNDGGLTCHAAIISREMGIPCIVGTNIATKVLKDGDMVEVDADKGIVRILRRA